MAYQHIKVPAEGTPITANEDHSLNVPNTPIIPYIEGDGIATPVTASNGSLTFKFTKNAASVNKRSLHSIDDVGQNSLQLRIT